MILLQSLIIRKYWLPVLLHFLKRSTHVPVSEEIEYKSVIFRPSKGLISYGADSAELTKNEMQILSVLLKNAGKSFPVMSLWMNCGSQMNLLMIIR